MQRHADRYVVVPDREAYQAGVYLLERTKVNAELAASCTLAAARRLRGRFGPDDEVVLVLCGGNVSMDDWADYRSRFGA